MDSVDRDFFVWLLAAAILASACNRRVRLVMGFSLMATVFIKVFFLRF